MAHKKILITDDEKYQRMLIEQSLEELEELGVELLMATNGEEALAVIQTEHPDLVILDVMMPKVDGFEVCQRVKANPTTKETYILMLTARGMEADKQLGLERGADRFMTKPFDPDELLVIARGVLGI